MVVENLRATGVISDEGGCDRLHNNEQRHLRQKVCGPQYKPKYIPSKTTGGDTLYRRCESYDMSPRSDSPIMTGGDTLDRWCEGHNISPGSDRRMATGRDTSYRRCEGHEMSPSSDRPMTMGGDTLRGVQAIIGAQLQNAPELM